MRAAVADLGRRKLPTRLLTGGEWALCWALESIRDRLLSLPPETLVLTGHGGSTTIGAEEPDLDEWVRRGH